MKKITTLSTIFCLVINTSVYAQGLSKWETVPGMTSARLAASGWQLSGVTKLSRLDNDRHAVVSYWQSIVDGMRITLRCISYFDASLRQIEDACFQAIVE